MYRTLDPDAIVTTIEQLHRRISERFPESGLAGVSGELLQVGRAAKNRIEEIRQPHIPLRIGVGLLILLIAAVLIVSVRGVVSGEGAASGEGVFRSEGLGLADLVALTEAALNEFVLLGALILFLVTLERRWRRKQALASIHELRSLAHIVDMHQLTKDPQQAFESEMRNTPSSPKRVFSPFQLSRYLDYCSEMFSLIGKVAALFLQGFDDASVIASVNDVDTLTTGLSRKVWQKMVILHSLQDGSAPLRSPKS